MAVANVFKNWFLKLDEVWAWISPLLPDFKIGLNEKQDVLDWVANYVTQPPNDFSESWRDGILLCELADKFSPDLFHGHGILDPKNCLHNVSLALEIIKGSFDIDPDVTPEDIVICAPQAERKLLSLLLKLKERVECDKTEDVVLNETRSDEDESSDSTQDDSFAQGAGLVIGFLGRKASFIVFNNGSLADSDVVVEIKGPADTYCCERITRRSPKRKRALPGSGTSRPMISQCGKFQSQAEGWAAEDTSKMDLKMIPLEYEINSDFISVAYIPLKTGLHTINIIWRGRYVIGSPFVAFVEDSPDVQGRKSALLKPPILRKETSQTISGQTKHSVRFKEPETNKMKLSNVRSRRVLRYIVKVGKKDVVVEAESSEMLAPALRKLDPLDEETTLGPRRSSWGFVGDVHSQRRWSLMRQVGIDDEEDDICRAHKRSFSVDISLAEDAKESGTTISRACPPSKTLVDPVGQKHASSNISSSDFDVKNDWISSKLPRLETVSEPFSPFTSDISAETDDKFNTSEDEVFYKDQHTPFSDTPNLTMQEAFPEHYTSEIFCEVNTSDLEEHKVEPQYPTARTKELQSDETSIDSVKIEEKSLDKKQEQSDSVENALCVKTANKHCTDNELRIEKPPKIRSTVTICSSKSSEDPSNLSQEEDCVSEKHALSETITESCTLLKQELHEDFNDHCETFEDEAEEIYEEHTFLPNENKMLRSEENILDDYDTTTNKFDSYCDGKTALLLLSERYDRDNELSKVNRDSQMKDNMDAMVNGSNAKRLNEENFEGHPQYCDTYNFEDVSIKPNISDKTIATEKLYISKAVTLINRTNARHAERKEMSDHHSESNEKDKHFLGEVQRQGFQEEHEESEITIMPLESESVQYGFQFSNRADLIFRRELSDNQSEMENSSKAQECFPLATKPTKSENTLQFSKTRRLLSHPYLKCTYHKTENNSLDQVPCISSKKNTKDLDLKGTDDKELSGFSLTRTVNSFDNVSENSTEHQQCQDFFTRPNGLSTSEKNSVLRSENMRFCLPESKGHSFQKEESKANEVFMEKPAVGDSPKFSLRCYKDKYRSEYEEEVVLSNTVKEIVKDFHSRSLEYPAPRSDKTNNIYLRRSFFPPLASNEGRKTVRNRISKWEKFPSMPETEAFAPESNKSSMRNKLSLYVNVQSKVAFWETAYHSQEDGEILDKENPSVSSRVHAGKGDPELNDFPEELQREDFTGFDCMRDSENAVRWEAQPHRDASRPVTSERTEDSGISDDLLMCLKTSDHKRPPVFLRHRSLSDPCIKPSSTRTADFLSNFEENLNIIPSSLYCSSEEKSKESVRDSEDGNDEYIDDEIPDYAAMLLGDYISFTGLLGPERSSLRKEAVTQYLQKLEDKSRHIFDPSLSKPHECRALGVGIHYGLVSMNNHFQVLTKGAGRGNLSVSIQGSGRHDVTKIIVTYSRNDVYDVMYQVLEPGYYIISVRWSDWSIPGSPFICKVTY